MPQSDPWKNRKSVRICACMDMIFALLVISVYVLRVVLENAAEDVKSTRGFFRPGEKPGITAALWASAFVINVAQLIIAYLLFSVVKKGLNQSECVIQTTRAKYWLILANIIFVMLISKFIFFVFFDKGNDSLVKVLMLILCVAELFFKGYAMYFVKEFGDDLKASFNPSGAKVMYIKTVGGGTKRPSDPLTTSV